MSSTVARARLSRRLPALGRARLVALLLGAWTLSPVSAPAQVTLYDNRVTAPGTSSSASDVDFALPGQFADGFVIDSTSEVLLTRIRWLGIYDFGDPTIPALDDFTVRLFRDAGGTPELVPFATFHVGNAVQRSQTGTHNQGFEVYCFSALVEATVLSGNAQHYISIFANTAGEPTTWAWVHEGDAQTESIFRRADTDPWEGSGTTNYAFLLEGNLLTGVREETWSDVKHLYRNDRR